MDVLVMDTSSNVLAIVDTYESLIWTDRYYGYGDFELYTPMSSDLTNVFATDRYLWSKESEHVMIIESLNIKSDIENGNHLIVTGRSIESLLDRRIIWSPTVLTGDLQSGIEKLLTENAISPADQNRKIPNLFFEPSTDSRILAKTVNAQFFGESLYDAISGLCLANDLGFKIELTSNGFLSFSLYCGQDRSYAQSVNPYVVFSPKFENLISSDYVESKTNLKNVALVMGEGEGASKKTAVAGAAQGLTRRELFVDAGGITSTVGDVTITPEEYTLQLIQKGNEKLAENQNGITFDGEVERSNVFKYGEDFFMGDIVQLTNEYGMTGRTRVVELIHSKDLSGKSTYPTFEIIS